MIRSYLAILGFWLWRGIVAVGSMLWALVRPGLRFISAALLLTAVIALVVDATRWQTGAGGPLFLSLDQHIRSAAPATLDGIGSALSAALHPILWDPVLTSVLSLPGWLSLFVLGLLISYSARERRQVDIFTN